MLDPLSLAVLMAGAFLMVVIGFSTTNSRWSTSDFLPIVLWMVTGVCIGLLIDPLLESLLNIDGKAVPTAIGLIVAGCGIRWYRTRLRQ
jgi:hypothetical protein